MRANSGSVITTLCALAGVVGLCMTTFGNANIGLTSFNLLLHLKAACRTFLPPERFPCLQSERKRRHLYGQVSAEWQAGGQILALYIEQVELNFYFIDFFLMCFGKSMMNKNWFDWNKVLPLSSACFCRKIWKDAVMFLYVSLNVTQCKRFYCLQMSKTYSSWVWNNGKKLLIVQWIM